jgi:hypothetical protein
MSRTSVRLDGGFTVGGGTGVGVSCVADFVAVANEGTVYDISFDRELSAAALYAATAKK